MSNMCERNYVGTKQSCDPSGPVKRSERVDMFKCDVCLSNVKLKNKAQHCKTKKHLKTQRLILLRDEMLCLSPWSEEYHQIQEILFYNNFT